MRNLKLLITTVFVFFVLGYTNAQEDKKSVTTDSWTWEDIMPCTDDYVSGIETVVVTEWNSKVQVRYKGEYEGESGKHYTWSNLINDNWRKEEGIILNRTYTSTSVVECEGVPVAIYKIRFHVVRDSDGQIKVWKYGDSGDGWFCL